MVINDAKCPCPLFQHRYVFRFESLFTRSFPSQLVNDWLDGVLRPLNSNVDYQGVCDGCQNRVFLTRLLRRSKKGHHFKLYKDLNFYPSFACCFSSPIHHPHHLQDSSLVNIPFSISNLVRAYRIRSPFISLKNEQF